MFLTCKTTCRNVMHGENMLWWFLMFKPFHRRCFVFLGQCLKCVCVHTVYGEHQRIFKESHVVSHASKRLLQRDSCIIAPLLALTRNGVTSQPEQTRPSLGILLFSFTCNPLSALSFFSLYLLTSWLCFTSCLRAGPVLPWLFYIFPGF